MEGKSDDQLWAVPQSDLGKCPPRPPPPRAQAPHPGVRQHRVTVTLSSPEVLGYANIQAT